MNTASGQLETQQNFGRFWSQNSNIKMKIEVK